MPKKPKAKSLPPRAGMGGTEAVFSDIARLLSSRQFDSVEDVNAFLSEQISGGRVPFIPESATPLKQAQSLMYQAWDTDNAKQRVALARSALALSPDCADAYGLLAEAAKSSREARALFETGVAAGERALGAEMAQLTADGAMWLAMESRPYMRAREALAAVCWEMGDRQRAIEHGWELLRLNPNDNQGIRYVLLGWLLRAGSIEQIERLLLLYPEDGSAAWLYGRVLHIFRTDGTGTSATAALRAASYSNVHVPEYLLGRKQLPDEMPEYIGFGDESEAIAYAGDNMALWLDVPGAMGWLDAKTAPRGGKRKPSR